MLAVLLFQFVGGECIFYPVYETQFFCFHLYSEGSNLRTKRNADLHS